MRLHRVAVQAFGPFAERVEVDLDALAEHGLFLLHGPTGAGKTSLLDAVCFALYGVVPGARSSLRATTLRSDHAEPGVAPVVECELTVGSRRLEVRRSPAWTRPKARGTGTTTEQSSVRVRELVDGRWEPLAARLDEAGHLLSGLLGMDAQQFTTVVLLPQGDFATFLRAGPDERRTVLERLFGTDRFAAVEAWLGERRAASGRAVREAQAVREQLLARVDERAAALRDHDGSDRGTDQDSDQDSDQDTDQGTDQDTAGDDGAVTDADAVTALYDLAARRLDRTRSDLARVRAGLEQARAHAERAADDERRHRVLLELVTARARLAAAAPHVDALRELLARHAAASTVRPHRDRLLAAEQAAAQAVSRLNDALAVLPPGTRSRDPRVLAERAGQVRAEVGALATLLGPEAEQAARAADLQRTETEHAATLGTLSTLAHRRTALEEQRAALDGRRREAAVAAGAHDAATAELGRARLVLSAVARVTALTPVVRAADDDVRTADEHATLARTAHLDLVERRLTGMAGELAAALADGAPCPVCGAAEHPHPATATDAVDGEQVAQALRLAEDAASTAVAARAVRDDLVRQLGAAEHTAAGAGAHEATTAVSHAERAVTAARAAADSLADLDVLADELEDTAARHEQEHEDLRRRLSWLGDRLAELRTRVGDLETRLGQARGTDPDVATRHARLTGLLGALDHATEAAREVPVARRTVRAARTDAETACAAAGLESIESLDSALLAPDAADQATTAVARHDREAGALEQRLADHPQAEHPQSDDPQAGTDDLERALAEAVARRAARVAQAARAEERVTLLTTRATVLEGTAVALHGLAADVATHDRTCAALAADAAVLDELAACALGTSGSNTLRMRLSAYVLAARLEQVAAAASARLRATSGGRYELRHTDARGKGGGRSGLGLTVVDHWTGQERATATLSGGETFLASLALALGLADVVQAESGGLAIETLFVDEGFGSLDDDALEMVMAGLDELREGGRAVGLVSHLPELRARIPSQLHVVRGERGSTVRALRSTG